MQPTVVVLGETVVREAAVTEQLQALRFRCYATPATLSGFLQLLGTAKPDVVVVDVDAALAKPRTVIEWIKTAHREADIRILVTSSSRVRLLETTLECGSGARYLRTPARVDELAEALGVNVSAIQWGIEARSDDGVRGNT